MKKIANQSELEKLASEDSLTILLFYEDWCPVCAVMLPAMESLESCYTDRAIFATINANENPAMKAQLYVSSIPTVFFVKNRKILNRIVGLQKRLELEVLIERYISINPEAQNKNVPN
jgi:thioredoxin-like negative regulator of GroEL